MNSIYDVICDSLTPEGRLPEGFVLPNEDIMPNEIGFAPGARDGISAYHFGASQPDHVAKELVQLVMKGKYGEIADMLHAHGTLHVIEPFLEALQEDHGEFDMHKVIEYACTLLFESTDAELVKFGIALLGILDLSNEPDMINAIKTLGLYDEFTLYAVVAIQHWANGNEILFSIAQKVDGWGKIHTVERLEAKTEEIRGWLLRYGCKNNVMDAYLGLVCAEKGNLIEALRQDSMDYELFEGVSVIIDALIEEGPVAGISAYEYADESIRLYLRHAQRQANTPKHVWYLLNVSDWMKDADLNGKSELMELCAGIINRPSWQGLIYDAIAKPDDTQMFYACNAAGRLNMDVACLLFQVIVSQPILYSYYVSYVYPNADFAKRLTAVYEEILPLREMALGMGDYHFAIALNKEHTCLGLVLQELDRYPNIGERLLKAALQSPVIRERNLACNVLKNWSDALKSPIFLITPEIAEILKTVAAVEVVPETKKRMDSLLRQ